MDSIVFKVEEQDRIYIENQCEKHLHTFDSFLKLLLNEHRMHRTAMVPRKEQEAPESQEAPSKETKKQNLRKNEKITGET